MIRGEEININQIVRNDPYFLYIWNPNPDNDDDETSWKYYVTYIGEENNIYTFRATRILNAE